MYAKSVSFFIHINCCFLYIYTKKSIIITKTKNTKKQKREKIREFDNFSMDIRCLIKLR